MTLTGDVNQGVFPGLPSEGSRLISNAGTRRISYDFVTPAHAGSLQRSTPYCGGRLAYSIQLST